MLSAISLGLIGASFRFILPDVILSDGLSLLNIYKYAYPRTNPSLSRLPQQKQNEARERAVHIPSLECDPEKPSVGFRGATRYHHAPRTTFQAWCRKRHTEDLQHFTRTLKPETVERCALFPGLRDTK